MKTQNSHFTEKEKKIADQMLRIMKRNTRYNYVHDITKREINEDPSETIPGQAYDVHTLIQKYRLNQPLNIKNKIPQFAESPSFDSVDPTTRPDFDLSDYTQIKNEINENRKLREAEKRAIEKEKKDRESEAVEAAKRSEAGGEGSDPNPN